MSLVLYADHRLLSPYAMSAYVALAEKNLPVELRRVDLAAGGQHEPAFAQLSLTQRVPLLVEGDFALSESSAMAEYLEDVYPGAPLYPVNRQARARARQVQAWLRSDLAALRAERPTEVIFLGESRPPLSPAARDAAGKLFKAAEGWLHHGGLHLCGEWSIADADLALMLNRLACNGDAMPGQLREYAAQQWQRPSVQRWVQLPR